MPRPTNGYNRDTLPTEVEHLLGTDHPERIAARLGYSNLNQLTSVLTKYGRPDVAGRVLREHQRVTA